MKFRLGFASDGNADLEKAKSLLKGTYRISDDSELRIEFETLEEVVEFVRLNYNVVITEEPAVIVYDDWLEVHE